MAILSDAALPDILVGEPVEPFVPPPGCRTIGHYLLSYATKHNPQELAFVNGEDPGCRDVLPFGELHRQAVALASGARAHPRLAAGLCIGDAIVVLCPNIVLFPVVVLGLNIAGFKVAPAHYGYTEHELEAHFRLVKAKAIFTAAPFLPIVRKAQLMAEVDLPIVVVPDGKVYGDLPDHGYIPLLDILNAAPLRLPSVDELTQHASPHDVAYLCLSSGTTGPSKAVQLSNFNLMAAAYQYEKQNAGPARDRPLHISNITPMVRISGLTNMACAIVSGDTLVLFRSFDVHSWIQAARRWRIQVATLVPAYIRELADAIESSGGRIESLERIVTGGSPLDLPTHSRCRDVLRVPISNMYGMTEAAPVVAAKPPVFPPEWSNDAIASSCGVPVPGLELVLVDPTTLAPVRRGELGEIVIRGPNVTTLGYLDNPDANATSFVALPFIEKESIVAPAAAASTPNRWLRSGDMGRIDERGELRIVDRIKELIKYRGVHVPPAEIEAVLLQHPRVVDAAVVGRPDEVDGELPMAFVVLSGSAGNTIAQQQGDDCDDGVANVVCQEIKAFVEQRVAPFKHLRGGMQIVSAIPRNPTGKILRRILVDQITQRTRLLVMK